MELLEIYSDGRSRAVLADGRIVVLSPFSLSGNRAISLESGEEIGLIQKLYSPNADQNLYLITEFMDAWPKVYVEYENRTALSLEEDRYENYLAFRIKHEWLLREQGGEELLEKLYNLCPSLEALENLFQAISNKSPSERKNRLMVIKKMVYLIEKPNLREKKQNVDFWTSTALPLMSLLGIKVD